MCPTIISKQDNRRHTVIPADSRLLHPPFSCSRCLVLHVIFIIIIIIIIIIIHAILVYILLSYYFIVNVLVSSTVATVDMWVGLCANIFTVEKYSLINQPINPSICGFQVLCGTCLNSSIKHPVHYSGTIQCISCRPHSSPISKSPLHSHRFPSLHWTHRS